MWLVAFFGAYDLSLRMMVHYTNAILYHTPFIGAWGPPPPVKRCIPALAVYLYPAMLGIAQEAPTPGCMPALVTFLYPGMFAVVEATPTHVPVSNLYGELGSKRGRPKGSTNKATARKPRPNARTLAAKNATSASRKITSMFERSPAEAGSSSSSALPSSTNGPVPRLQRSTYSSSSSSSSRTGDRESGPSSGSRSTRPNGAPQSSTSFGAEF